MFWGIQAQCTRRSTALTHIRDTQSNRRWRTVRRSVEEERESVCNLSASDLKRQLNLLGQDVRFVFEKGELVTMLAAARNTVKTSVVRFPLRQTQPTPASPKVYVTVPVDVGDAGFVDFALDTGATGTLITPTLRDTLGLSASEGSAVKGLGLGGATIRQQVALPPLQLGSQPIRVASAIVTELRSSNLTDVGGMLGMEVLKQFDVELDFDRQQVSFWPPGSAGPGCVLDTANMASLSCANLIGGLASVHVSANRSLRFLAIVDLATMFSVMNWKAANLAGLSSVVMTDLAGASAEQEASIPIYMASEGLELVLGDPTLSDIEAPLPSMKPLIADLPAFAALRLNEGPAMLLGMDVLGQNRTILSLAKQRIFLGK